LPAIVVLSSRFIITGSFFRTFAAIEAFAWKLNPALNPML
jgi:hypothetical protein